jgi:hypothetical protein
MSLSQFAPTPMGAGQMVPTTFQSFRYHLSSTPPSGGVFREKSRRLIDYIAVFSPRVNGSLQQI